MRCSRAVAQSVSRGRITGLLWHLSDRAVFFILSFIPIALLVFFLLLAVTFHRALHLKLPLASSDGVRFSMCQGWAVKNIASDTSAAKMVEGPTWLCRCPIVWGLWMVTGICFHLIPFIYRLWLVSRWKVISNCIALKYYYYLRLGALTCWISGGEPISERNNSHRLLRVTKQKPPLACREKKGCKYRLQLPGGMNN